MYQSDIFEITRSITPWIVLHSVQSLLLIVKIIDHPKCSMLEEYVKNSSSLDKTMDIIIPLQQPTAIDLSDKPLFSCFYPVK